MKMLIVDDDPTSAKLLLSFLKESGVCHTAHSGQEALEAVKYAMEAERPYDLICLDIMMPIIDGHEALRTIREFEESTFNVSGKRAKIIMTTALDDFKTVMQSFHELCDAYLTKPIKKQELESEIRKLGLVSK